MENKIKEMEDKINRIENRMDVMEIERFDLLEKTIKILEERLELLKEKQERENTTVYEHLQFMNYSQKIKNTENTMVDLKNELNKLIREKTKR